jgi:trehalose 6-phosphate phosphatase
VTRAPPPRLESHWALFLDLDGTLIEIAATPADVCVPPRLPALLLACRETLGGALALVSGREIVQVDQLLAPLRFPVAGAHGAERRDAAGVLQPAPRDDAVTAARALLMRFVERHPGLLLEDKGSGLALHFRQAPALAGAARAQMDAALAQMGPRYALLEGKQVLEIKLRAVTKGRAIEAFMAEPPFAGRLPVFIGDDVTDESGFAAVNDAGGHSIIVGAREPTLARWRLTDVTHVLDWMAADAAP